MDNLIVTQNINLDIQAATFNSGLQLYHITVPSDDVSILAQVNAGPLHEKGEEAGISHLMEHMLFRGTDMRKDNAELFEEISLLGNNFSAYTSQTGVVIEFRTILSDLDQAMDFISDAFFNSKLEKEKLAREKPVILDEMRRGNDEPDSVLFDEYFARLYTGTPLGKPIIGFPETVNSFGRIKLLNFYHKICDPANMTVLTAGPQKFDDVKEMVFKHFEREPKSFRHNFPIINASNKAREYKIEKDLENVHFAMGRIVSGYENQADHYALNIMADVLSTKLFDVLRSKSSLCYSCGASYDPFVKFGDLTFDASCKPQDFEKLNSLLFEEIDKFREGKNFSERDVLNKIVSVKKQVILGTPSTMGKLKLARTFLNRGDIYAVNNYLPKFDGITKDKIIEVAQKNIKFDDLTKVIVGKVG